ncbi:MAG: hypothetical protein AABX11_00005 [Nanoarchaeota archaeon]
MGGNSYSLDCARCGGKGTLYCSTETKPFEYNSTDCLNCGFSSYTKVLVLKKGELKQLRKNMNFKSKSLTSQEKDSCKEFDKIYLVTE